MRSLNIPLEDEEYKRLKKAKGTRSWHDFIMTLAGEVKK